MKKRKPDSSKWCPLAGQEATGTNENTFVKTHVVPSEHNKTFLYAEGGQTLEQVPGVLGSLFGSIHL